MDYSCIYKKIIKRSLVSFVTCLTLGALVTGGQLLAQVRPNPFLSNRAYSTQGFRPNSVSHPNQGVNKQNDPALSLLRRAQSARNIALAGEQTTVLFGPQNEQSTQTIYRDAQGDYRCEYHTPPKVSGEIVITRPDISWHYIPSHHELKVGKGRPHAGEIGLAIIANAIHSGRAIGNITGQDTVAGRGAVVVSVVSSGGGPSESLRLWIDQQSGALLRTDVYAADNQPISSTYFTELTLNPQLPPDAFDQPQVAPNTKSTQNQPGDTLNHIPTDAEAGFHVLIPTYVPPGFTFETARVFQAMSLPAVNLRYKGNLSTLSIFEGPMLRAGGNGVARSPIAGTVLLNHDGMRTVAIGPLSTSDLTQVLRSLR